LQLIGHKFVQVVSHDLPGSILVREKPVLMKRSRLNLRVLLLVEAIAQRNLS